jgi:hypothetical protein
MLRRLPSIRPLVEPLYAKKGRPSVNPEIAFRAMVPGYFFALTTTACIRNCYCGIFFLPNFNR